jgi:hypothetical protein
MFIPDLYFFHPGSRNRNIEFRYFNPKKWFLSSRKYHPGCSFRIQRSKRHRIPDPDRNTVFMYLLFFIRREIDSALLDRDRVLKENHELREKLGEREKSTGQSRERNKKCIK